MAFAGGMPLVWVAAAFSERRARWAHDRGPMTLLDHRLGCAAAR